MKIYSEKESYILYNDDMRNMEQDISFNSIDSIICDPPYELNFMGKGWDNTGIAFQKETWEHCFNVLKPGGYLLAFGGSRTFHRIACAIEDAGFEIRDTIMWLYGSGFPKSMNIGVAIDKKNGVESEVVGDDKSSDIKKSTNEWNGWGTCLKPAFEPIIIARKPFKGSLVDNVIKNGVGGINIDECRVAFNGDIPKASGLGRKKENHTSYSLPSLEEKWQENSLGRFPANVIITYDETDFEEVCGGMPNDNSVSASRYFYCAKASKKDRNDGLDNFPIRTKVFNGKSNVSSTDMKDVEKRFTTNAKNIHPTVKPTELMQYLIRLVTPKGGTILDCFMGSGSTGKAVMFENRERNSNYKFIGIELTEEYLPICKARINYALNGFEYEKNNKDEEVDNNNDKVTLF